jgi:hypothetical protein
MSAPMRQLRRLYTDVASEPLPQPLKTYLQRPETERAIRWRGLRTFVSVLDRRYESSFPNQNMRLLPQ